MKEVFQYSTAYFDVYHTILESKQEAEDYNKAHQTNNKLGDTIEIRKWKEHCVIIEREQTELP